MLESFDLLPLQTVLSITGALLAIYAMQLPSALPAGEMSPARLMRRIGIAFVAGGMLWSVRYAFYHDWQPWPPYILILIGINVALLASVITGSSRSESKVT